MAQLKQVCTVANGGQTVSVIGVNVAYRIRKNNIFMVSSDLVPYTVAADATFDGNNTVVLLTGAYQGVSNTMAPSAFVTDFTAPDNLPLISQGDVGTAAIWTATMYQLQAMIGSVTPAGLTAFITQINATQADAAASRDASKTSETNSKTSETNAAASKSAAGVSAAAALASQNAAKTSETNSKTSEINSSASAADARTSNTQSGASAAASEVSRQASGVSATSSAASAAAAQVSKTNAGASETNAGASAAAAAASKGAAGTSETNAGLSKTAAAASAAAALASQTAAKTSETNSKTSETNAAQSAATTAANMATVQGIVTSMNALYLGKLAADPVKDNNGAALQVGAEYFSTTKQLMRVYTSTGWQDVDQTSETMAANATASAAAAAGSAAGAASSLTSAQAAQAAALASQGAAKTSETNSKTSETNTSASAAAALASKNAAKTSETNSATSEANAAASAAHADAVASSIGNPVSKNGDTMAGQLRMFEGTVQAPGLSWDNDGTPDTGFWHIGDGSFGATNNGVETARFTPDGTIFAKDAVADNAKFQSTRYGNGGALVLRSAAGTAAAPTALLAASQAMTLVARGYDGANYQDLAGIDAWTEGDLSASSAPGSLRFYTTPAGAIGKLERMRITPSGRVLIGTGTDDGVSALQVVGQIKGAASSGALNASNGGGTGQTSIMLTREGAATNEKRWEILHGSSGTLSLRAVNDAYSASQSAFDITRPTGGGVALDAMKLMSGGGRVLVGAPTDDGTSLFQVGGTSTAVSNANGTIGSFSPSSYAGGLAIEAYNLQNTTKKNVALAPWGGRVLVGTATDDTTNLLQVGGAGKFAGDLQIYGGSGASYSARLVLNADGYTPLQRANKLLQSVEFVNAANTFVNFSVFDTGVVSVNRGRLLVGPVTDDGSTSLQVNGWGTFTGGLNVRGGSIELGSTTAASSPFIDFHSTASANDYDARIIATGGTAGTVGAAALSYFGSSHVFNSAVISSSTSTIGTFQATGDMGGGFAVWNGARGFALNVSAPTSTSAYGGIRWTRLGSRHLAAIDAYEGGSATSAPTIVMHVDGQANAWTFGRTDISRGAGGTVWHTVNLPAPAQTTGAIFSGQVDHSAPVRMLVGSEIQFWSPGNSYYGRLRADVAGLIGFINQANTAWNMQVTDAGQVTFPRARPTWAGLTPWDNGNFNPAAYQAAGNYARLGQYNDATSFGLSSGAAPSISAISSQSPCLILQNGGNNSASCVINFRREGSFAAYFGLDTDNQWAVGGGSHGSVRYRLWHEGNFNPGSYQPAGSYATLSAQVQYGSGISEIAGVVTGADVTADAGGPWVVQGLRTVGGNNRIYMRVVWLRNQ